ncbi:class I SAM-dependent methyltransferase [Ahrensia kielensis]|uniref:class I SAM-dependent methyltransferase n=1 Tax=Ahrensia kielensis TaxID=76980 RepID=UPI000372984D|nr:class I SAM-dependent methyltransferase [Ahrensia kielensis]
MLIRPARFWNFMARGYARRPVKDTKSYQHKLDITASYLQPTDTVFEFGCGSGTTSLIHAPRVSHIDAIDFSSEMIAIATEKASAKEIQNVKFFVSTLQDWPQPQNGSRYDAVLGMSILHLLPDLDDALAQVHKLMKPGAYFFSSTVCLGDMNALIHLALAPFGALGLIPKVLPLKADELAEHMMAHGFTIESTWHPKDDATVFIVARKPV